jgi:hypothetical protein
VNVILYTNGKDRAKSERLQEIVDSVDSLEQVETFRAVEDLSRRANRFPREIDVALLYAQSSEQLSELVALKDLLEDVPIILILPDRSKRTISKGLELYPRFYSYADGDFADVAGVLEKMVRKIRSKC